MTTIDMPEDEPIVTCLLQQFVVKITITNSTRPEIVGWLGFDCVCQRWTLVNSVRYAHHFSVLNEAYFDMKNDPKAQYYHDKKFTREVFMLSGCP